MRNPRPLPILVFAVCPLVLATLFLVACQASQPTGSAPPPPPAPSEKVSIVFEGPWAIAPDPKDANKILLIAPKTKSHQDLYVTASNNATLASGVYELSVPVSGTPGATTPATDMVQAKTTAGDLQSVLDAKSQRYVIRLPKPEAYLAAARYTSRVGASYPPDASTEKNYVTVVALRYSVSSMNGFSLSGSPDSGSFNPKLLQVEAGMVSFLIEPSSLNPLDKCHVHTREAFRDLTHLLKLTLYIDFPDSPASCHDTDPQKSKAAAQNGAASRPEELLALLTGNVADVQTASLVPEITAGNFLFGHLPYVCTGAIIILNLG